MRLPRARNRNPYPVPDVSSEGFWIEDGPILGRNVSANDRSWTTKLEVYDRLFAHHTLNSVRRDQRFIRDMVPNDGLDFALSSIYIHSEDFMVPKNYVPMQPETLNLKTWRVLRNEFPSPNRRVATKAKHNSAKKKGLGAKAGQSAQYGRSASSKAYNRASPSRGFGRTTPNRAYKTPPSRGFDRTSPTAVAYNKSSPGRGYGRAPPSGRSKTAPGRAYTTASPTRGYGRASPRPKHDRTTSARSGEPIGDDILDKEQRHKTYAAQMRPIERVHPSSLKLAVDGPHSDQTNPGYSRKIDGTFYGI